MININNVIYLNHKVCMVLFNDYCLIFSFLLGILASDPCQSPLEVGQHVLHGFRPLLLGVELHLHRVSGPRSWIPDLALLHLVGEAEPTIALLNLMKAVSCGYSMICLTSSLNCWRQSRKAAMPASNLVSHINLNPPDPYKGRSLSSDKTFT